MRGMSRQWWVNICLCHALGPWPVLVDQEAPSHVPGEVPQVGLYNPYSSVLLLQLNKGEKRDAETSSWTKHRAPRSHSSIPRVPDTFSSSKCPPLFSPFPSPAPQPLHSTRQRRLPSAQKRLQLDQDPEVKLFSLGEESEQGPHVPLHPSQRPPLHRWLLSGLRR